MRRVRMRFQPGACRRDAGGYRFEVPDENKTAGSDVALVRHRGCAHSVRAGKRTAGPGRSGRAGAGCYLSITVARLSSHARRPGQVLEANQ